MSLPERVVARILDTYARLPRHGKPTTRDNGVPEWTMLAGICLSRRTRSGGDNGPEQAGGGDYSAEGRHGNGGEVRDGEGHGGDPEEIIPVSLGTGVKVLPAARLPPLGDALHDSHAEILARRGLVRYLVAEARGAVARGGGMAGVGLSQNGDPASSSGSDPNSSSRPNSNANTSTRRSPLSMPDGTVVYNPATRKFALAPGVQVWLYVSALPCGDASTLHTSAHQPPDIAAAFAAAPEHTITPEGAVRGRKGYELHGTIRTKPGRADSPPSISFSCSDKIASWSVLGLQGALLEVFEPVYVDHIVVGGVVTPLGREAEAWEAEVRAEVERALGGRLGDIKDPPAPFRLTRPKIHITRSTFPDSKPAVEAKFPGADPATSNVSLSYVPSLAAKPEVITNGTLGNAWRAPGHKLVKDKQRSKVCKVEIMRAYLDLLGDMGEAVHPDSTYFELKRQNTAYQAAKARIRGRAVGELSEAWRALLPHEFPVTAAEASERGADQGVEAATSAGGGGGLSKGAETEGEEERDEPPFTGWITCGERYESFTRAGTLVGQ